MIPAELIEFKKRIDTENSSYIRVDVLNAIHSESLRCTKLSEFLYVTLERAHQLSNDVVHLCRMRSLSNCLVELQGYLKLLVELAFFIEKLKHPKIVFIT
jgi:hypothetical protein